MDSPSDQQQREVAIKRLKDKSDFKVHLFVYAAVNAMLVLIWTFAGPGYFFWPIFVMVFWGIGVAINGYNAYGGNRYSEEQIQREMKRLS